MGLELQILGLAPGRIYSALLYSYVAVALFTQAPAGLPGGTLTTSSRWKLIIAVVVGILPQLATAFCCYSLGSTKPAAWDSFAWHSLKEQLVSWLGCGWISSSWTGCGSWRGYFPQLLVAAHLPNATIFSGLPRGIRTGLWDYQVLLTFCQLKTVAPATITMNSFKTGSALSDKPAARKTTHS